MPKDPALLFYTSDFLTGTMLMTHEQVGIYIRVLCLMHQNEGRIDRLGFDAYVGNHDIIRNKFDINTEYVTNKRLTEEIDKRRAFSDSRRNNRMSKTSQTSLKDKIPHMENENENENENRDKDIITKRTTIRFKKPTLEQVKAYCLEIKSPIDPDYFFNTYESQGWIKANGRPVLNWKSTIRTWEKRNEKSNGGKINTKSESERLLRKEALDKL